MTRLRPLAALTLATAALAVLALIPTPALDLVAGPNSLLDWWDANGTAAAAIGLLHLVALATAVYVVAVLAVVVAAQVVRLPGVAASTAALIPGALRHYVMVGVVAGSLAIPTLATGGETVALRDHGPAPSAPITLVDLGPVAAAASDVPAEPTVTAAADVAPSPADETDPSRESFRPPALAPAPDAWQVEAGENLWTIAASVLEEHLRERPDDADIWTYWRELIAANVRSVADPDVIHPEQVLTLPPVVTAGS